jgi:hypothetical protein
MTTFKQYFTQEIGVAMSQNNPDQSGQQTQQPGQKPGQGGQQGGQQKPGQQTQQPSQKPGQGGQQGVFYLLDRSSIESEVFFPSKIHDVKLERYSTSLHTFVARSVFCQFFKCRRKNSIPVKCPNPFLLARNLVSANSIESRSGQPSRLLNNQGSKRR